jgi:hypothetical protein
MYFIILKAKFSLCSTKHQVMKTYWGSGGIAPRILDLGLDGGEWSVSRPGRFTPRERAPGIHWIGGWVGSSGHGGEEKNSQLPLGIEP